MLRRNTIGSTHRLHLNQALIFGTGHQSSEKWSGEAGSLQMNFTNRNSDIVELLWYYKRTEACIRLNFHSKNSQIMEGVSLPSHLIRSDFNTTQSSEETGECTNDAFSF